MNQVKAILASILITGLVACVMLVIGWSALLSRSAVNVSAASNVSSVNNNATEAPLRELVNQYQIREQQLRAQLDEANKQLEEKDHQLAQANQQIQQFENLVQALQARGIIQITADGHIRLPSR